jgi:beta-glucosidase
MRSVRALAGLACIAAVTTRLHAQSAGETRFVDSILSRMTLEEKAGQLNLLRGAGVPTGPASEPGSDSSVITGRVGLFYGVRGLGETRRLQHIAVTETRLHIPLIFGDDAIHGYRTIFPVPLGEAASWDTAAARESASLTAIEVANAGIAWTFAPMVDIARDPRWGRIVEGAGEDPLLGAAFAAARVRGFQSTNPPVMATAKHFVGYGAAEGGRDYNTADMSDRTLRDIYLPPFRAAVDAGAKSVMAGFDALNGIPMHANRPLLTGVLRDQWHFDGIIVSDYTGVMELTRHGVAASPAEAAERAINAGVDVDMVSGFYVDELPKLVRSGRVKLATVNKAVRRVLRAKYELGLFQNPYRYGDTTARDTLFRSAARRIARESIVLLKNHGHTLPFDKHIKTLAVIGALATDSASALGPWAAIGRPSDAVSVLKGIQRAVSADIHIITTNDPSADAIVLVLGETSDMSGEASSRAYLDLPDDQLALAQQAIATGKPVAVILMNGRPLSVSWLDEHADAIVESWFLGVEHGDAVADVLFGDYNPSGKLPVTFPRTVGQVPIYYDHLPTGRPPNPNEHYTSKYIDAPWTPLYPFGYGLSYTSFAYDSLRATVDGDTLRVSAVVTNSGDRAGVEVAQCYTHTLVASVSQPVRVLRGFRRVSLASGERRTVTFAVPVRELGVDEPTIVDATIGPSSAAEGPVSHVHVAPPHHARALR